MIAKGRVWYTIIAPFSFFALSLRFHWIYYVKNRHSMVVGLLTCPMQGPQAFARTTAPTSSNTDVTLSRSIVALICSDPGVHRKGT